LSRPAISPTVPPGGVTTSGASAPVLAAARSAFGTRYTGQRADMRLGGDASRGDSAPNDFAESPRCPVFTGRRHHQRRIRTCPGSSQISLRDPLHPPARRYAARRRCLPGWRRTHRQRPETV